MKLGPVLKYFEKINMLNLSSKIAIGLLLIYFPGI